MARSAHKHIVQLVVKLVVLLFSTLLTPAWAGALFIEEMTWPEVRDAIASGKSTAIVFAGSTEQNGPHMVLGKHNFIARSLAASIAKELGNALIYPVVPFAPTGDPELHSGHMRFPGSVSVEMEVYVAMIRDLARSAISAGFHHIIIMADHGGGQDELEQLALEMDIATRSKGARIFYIGEVYDAEQAPHAGRLDTSTLMAIDADKRWVRPGVYKNWTGTDSGAESDPQDATPSEGLASLRKRTQAAVKKIQDILSTAPAH